MSGEITERATIQDVATRAGVSKATVSKALNGRGQLRQVTRHRVLEAARELQYEPNRLASGLQTGRSYTVGLITTDNFGRFTAPMALGAENTLGGQISAFLCDGRGDPIREQHYIRTLLARRVDGLIITGRRHEARAPVADGLPVPVVYALSPSQDPDDISVVVDDAQGAQLATDHLIATGRRRIAHITGPNHHLSARLRDQGMRDALTTHGLQPGQTLWGEWSEAWGYSSAHLLVRDDRDVDAILCGSDQIARGAVDALREAGLRVPGDIAVVGFDNWDVIATACRPPLTTVDLNLLKLGRAAATQLLSAIDGEDVSGIRKYPCELVVRQSTGPAEQRQPA
jgi:LacI family transcriptional regulator